MSDLSELETKPGLLRRGRKAVVAGGIAFAASLGPSIVLATADGQVSVGEVAPLVVTAVGLGIGAAFAVFWTPNATGPAPAAPDPGPAELEQEPEPPVAGD